MVEVSKGHPVCLLHKGTQYPEPGRDSSTCTLLVNGKTWPAPQASLAFPKIAQPPWESKAANGWDFKYKKLDLKKVQIPGNCMTLHLFHPLHHCFGEWRQHQSLLRPMPGSSVVNSLNERNYVSKRCVIQYFPCEGTALVSHNIALIEVRR